MPRQQNAFITGITGFVGKYLSEHLIGKGYAVYGLDRWPHCDLPGVTYFAGDILDTASLAQIFSSVHPDRIFHLAAISFPPEADLSPRLALDINIMGTVSLLDAARQSCPSSAILLVGSSKEYSDACDRDPIDETTPCAPTNFYGISKYAAEMIALQFSRQYGMDIRCTRSFNHTGPGQPPHFVCSDWAKQSAEIALGKSEPRMRAGDLSPAIDFTDVRDVVRAYALILEKGRKGETYNVCSGKTMPLHDIIAALTAKAGVPVSIAQDEAKLRAHKTGKRTTGDPSKLTGDTGWQPEIPMEKTLDDIYRYWFSRLKSNGL
jgi:GDP-4-dehydro-6-deoxy-D-mannose reductase